MSDAVLRVRRYAHFDGLRAVAVAMVMYHHWVFAYVKEATCAPWDRCVLKIPIGGLGVAIFFVLSGFLITDILLKGQGLVGRERLRFLRAFYFRRSLRIFPVYYFLITVAALLALSPFRADFYWLAGYATNVLVFVKQRWIGMASHLWTLAVEEQFYLLLPLVVVFFARGLRRFLVGLVLFGMVYKLIGAIFFPEIEFLGILPLVSMDALAVGGILALRSADETFVCRIAPRLAWMLLLYYPLAALGLSNPVVEVVAGYAVLGFAVVVVKQAQSGYRGLFGVFFDLRSVRYLGVISYGLYLYHNLAGWGVTQLTQLAGFSLATHGLYWSVGLQALLTVVVAALSWELIERPINGLKRFFPYTSGARGS